MVLVAIAICQKHTQNITSQSNNVWLNTGVLWCFTFKSCAIFIFLFHYNVSLFFLVQEMDHRSTCLYFTSRHKSKQHSSLWCLLTMSVELKYHFLNWFSLLLIILIMMPCRVLMHKQGQSLQNLNNSFSKHKTLECTRYGFAAQTKLKWPKKTSISHADWILNVSTHLHQQG